MSGVLVFVVHANTLLRGGYGDPHTTGALVFVLLRPALLDDEDAVVV
jgi:hypothetical protein